MSGIRTNALVVNIFDAIENKYLAKSISMKKAAELLGTTYKNVNFAKARGSLIQRRYLITDAGKVHTAKPEIDKEFISYANDLKERWDDAVKPFRIAYRKRNKVSVTN